MKPTKRFLLVSLIFYIETLVILYLYKPGLGDVNLLISGGGRIIEGANPYLGHNFGNSPIAGAVFYAISLITPPLVLGVLVPLLNATGYLFFTKIISEQFKTQVPFALLLLPLLAPYRAMISAGQISGIVILLLIPLFIQFKSRKLAIPVQTLSAILALELKPQIAIPFLICALAMNMKDIRIWTIALLGSVLHLFTFLFVSSELDGQWLSSTFIRSRESLLDSPQVSLWKYLNHLYANPPFWRAVSAILFVLALLLLYVASRKRTLLALGAIPPLLLTYQHLYDLLPLAIYLLILVENKVGGVLPYVVFFTFLNLPINYVQAFLITLLIIALHSIIRSQRIDPKLGIICCSLLLPLLSLSSESIEVQYSYLSGLIAIVGVLLTTRFSQSIKVRLMGDQAE